MMSKKKEVIMDTILRIALVIAGLALFILMILIFLGNPNPKEPRFLRPLRFNMYAEMLALIGHGILNPRLLSYRATKAEKAMPLPGDELVIKANSENTYANTIDTTPESIWPWLVQMGDGKAAWYCWSPMHELPEYKHQTSTYSIHPEWQNLKVGDILTDGDVAGNCSETRGAWRVMELQERQSIVFFSARDFIDGFEFDPKTTRPKKIYGITSWVFYIYPFNINPMNAAQSRLLIRVRAEVGPKLLRIVARLVFGFGDAIFERTILDGIKVRVEGRNERELNENGESSDEEFTGYQHELKLGIKQGQD
jgi:hypothetical protein